jgi:hypothetical protein
MQFRCPACQRVLHYSGDCPSFCAYCGKPISQPLQTAQYAAEPPTRPAPPPTPAPEAETIASLAGDRAAPAPEAIGGYRLLRRLGGGGMGEVFEAEDGPGGRRVAIKLIAADCADSEDSVNRFRREGRVASSLAHPRCVFVYAADEDAGRPYIVMELMPGQNLQQLVDEGGPLAPGEAVAKILDVIDGLSEAHAQGLVHRDVKPSNCFLEADGRVKVGDFGLAKSLTVGDSLTKTGHFVGTTLYASPEQVRRDPLDAQSDLYSATATLYFLLTGQAPFQGGDAVATVARIMTESARSTRSLRPEVPPALDRVVLRGLERDPARRWHGLEEFRQALLPFASRRPDAGPPLWRLAAFLVDALVIVLVPRLIESGIVFGFDLTSYEWIDTSFSIVIDAFVILYFTMTEGIWGRSAGKWLLGLRVTTVDGSDPPGPWRSLLRAVVFQGLNLAASVLVTLSTLGVLAAGFDWAYWTLQVVGTVVPLIGMSKRSGYRGLHERLSGTRTVLADVATRPLIEADDSALEALPAAGLPERIGRFRVRGAFRNDADEQILLAEDAALGRPVLLRRRPRDRSDNYQRETLTRSTRSRWVAGGDDGDWHWDAFLVAPGRSLPDVVAIRKRFCWAETRQVLEQLADELAAAEADGSLPVELTTDQVWLRRGGRLLLLDSPLRDKVHHHPLDTKTASRSVPFLAAVAVLALEGRPRRAGDCAAVAAPIPVHARELVNRLVGHAPAFQSAAEFVAALAATRHRPTELTPTRRATELATAGICLLPGLAFMLVIGASVIANAILPEVQSRPVTVQRANAAVEIRAGADLAAGLAFPDWPTRLRAVQQWQEDQRLRERLRSFERPCEQMAAAMRQYSSWGTRMWADATFRERQESAPERHKSIDAFPLKIEELERARGRAEVWCNSSTPQIFFPRDGPFFALLFFSFFPAVWTVWAFVTRGGVNYWLHDMSLVRGDGRPAGRFHCAWRALLVWAPVAGLLWCSLALDHWYWTAIWKPGDPFPVIPWLSWILWWSGAALLPLWLALAIRFPQRGLHDYMAGTYLVPN